MVNGRTHWPYTAAGGRGGAGYRRKVAFKNDRGGKGKSKRLKMGHWLRKKGISLGLYFFDQQS